MNPQRHTLSESLRELAANKKDKKISMAARTAVKSISGKKN